LPYSPQKTPHENIKIAGKLYPETSITVFLHFIGIVEEMSSPLDGYGLTAQHRFQLFSVPVNKKKPGERLPRPRKEYT
jgi:hypothetical protein